MISSVPSELLEPLEHCLVATRSGRCLVLLLAVATTASPECGKETYQATGILSLDITALHICDDKSTSLTAIPMGYNGPLTPDYSDLMAPSVQPPPPDLVHTYRMVSVVSPTVVSINTDQRLPQHVRIPNTLSQRDG